ncbi:11051_t:CDS:1, partial [Scutellospora calospora]
LLRRYLLVRPKTADNELLFLSKHRKQLIVGSISAIVKRIANNAGAKGRFIAYSIRISSTTAAIEAGLSLIQICTIES